MKKIIVSLGLIGSLFTGSALAGESEIMATLSKINVPTTGVKVLSSPINGMKMVMTTQGIFYVSDDGRYVTQGPIYDMQSGTPKDVTSKTVADLVNSVAKDAIVYKADNEQYVITVFTDITCGYCKKFHEEIGDYNKQGITVRYLAFPRQGPDSETGKEMQSIWSSADRKSVFDSAYKGNKVPEVQSMVPYVEHHFQVGRQIGITGTPTIVLADGQMIGGYVPAEKLKAILEQGN